MKITILSIAALFLLVFLGACNQKKLQDNTSTDNVPSQEETKDDSDGQIAEKAYQTIGFRKTPCFGKCPVYEVKFFTDNTATWHGKMNVERMGWYEVELGEETIKAIRDKAHEVGFFDFHYEYPIKHKVADLPSTITYLRIGDVEKTVKNTHEGPEKLAELEAYIEDIINKLDWKASPRD